MQALRSLSPIHFGTSASPALPGLCLPSRVPILTFIGSVGCGRQVPRHFSRRLYRSTAGRRGFPHRPGASQHDTRIVAWRIRMVCAFAAAIIILPDIASSLAPKLDDDSWRLRPYANPLPRSEPLLLGLLRSFI